MAFLELIGYGINEAILVDKLHITDVGGSLVIHAFGAFFGLAVSLVLKHSVCVGLGGR